MLTIAIGSATDPREVQVSPNDTLREALRDNNVTVGNGLLTINAKRMGENDMDKTLADLGVTDGSFITVTQKMDSGLVVRY